MGLRAAADTGVESVAFEGASLAIDIDGGEHRMREVTAGSNVVNGIDLAPGAKLTVERSSFTGLTGAAAILAGLAEFPTVIVGSPASGLTLTSSGQLALADSTVTGSTGGAGVDNTANGAVTSIDWSIVWGNAGGDLVNVACGVVTSSDVGSPDCSSVGGNLSADPLLDPGFEPQAGSPVIDYGPDPATFAGVPCFDVTGGPRLRDRDGDGMARRDIGAVEANATLDLGIVGNLHWSATGILEWDSVAGATEYHVYRETSGVLGYASFGSCIDEADPDRTDVTFAAAEDPGPGIVFYYRITAETAGGEEGSLGLATCVERSNFNPCP